MSGGVFARTVQAPTFVHFCHSFVASVGAPMRYPAARLDLQHEVKGTRGDAADSIAVYRMRDSQRADIKVSGTGLSVLVSLEPAMLRKLARQLLDAAYDIDGYATDPDCTVEVSA